MAYSIRECLKFDKTAASAEESESSNSDDSLETNNSPKLLNKSVNKTKKKYNCRASPLWNFFERISNNRARCEFCDHELSCKSTIFNLARHLARKHPIVHRNFQNNKNRTFRNNSKRNSEDNCSSSQKLVSPIHTNDARKNIASTNKSLNEDSPSEEVSSCVEESNVILIKDARSITSITTEEIDKPSHNTSLYKTNDKKECFPSGAEDMQTIDTREFKRLHNREINATAISELQKANSFKLTKFRKIAPKPESFKRLLNGEANTDKPADLQKTDSPKPKKFRKNAPKLESFIQRTESKEAMIINDELDRILQSKNLLEEKRHNQVVSDAMKMIIENQKSLENTVQVLNSNLVNMTNAVLNLCKVGEKIADSLSKFNSCENLNLQTEPD